MRKIWRVVTLAALLAATALPLDSAPALAVTTSFNSTSSDGYLFESTTSSSAFWSWVFAYGTDSSTAVYSASALSGVKVSTLYDGTNYLTAIDRAALYFDTAAIPDG